MAGKRTNPHPPPLKEIRINVVYDSKSPVFPRPEKPRFEDETIRKVISDDGRASEALRKLRASGVNVDRMISWLPDYVKEVVKPAPRHKPRAYFTAPIYSSNDPRWYRRPRITPEKLKSLPGRLRGIADEFYLLDLLDLVPEPLPDRHLAHVYLTLAADWLERKKPSLPDARFLRGANEALRCILSYTVPQRYSLPTKELAGLLSRLLEPVARQYRFQCPSTDSLVKTILRMRTR